MYQAEIDTASKNIIDAISALVLETPVIKYADLKALQTAIMKAKTFTSSAYTPQSFAALQKSFECCGKPEYPKTGRGTTEHRQRCSRITGECHKSVGRSCSQGRHEI